MLMRGQIWVETVLYTLLGLGLMGLVLAFALPKITAAQERAIVEQSIQSMDALYGALETVQTRGVGNVKVVSFSLQAGSVLIDGVQDTLVLTLPEQKSIYSQPGSPLTHGPITILTEERAGMYQVRLTVTLPDTNLTVNGKDIQKTLNAVSTTHRITVSAVGTQPEKTIVSLETS
jgi:type II secretory pathway pseudopilin PulG